MRSRLSFALYSFATIGAIRRNPFIRAYSSWFAPKNPGVFPGVFIQRKELAFLTRRQLLQTLGNMTATATFSPWGMGRMTFAQTPLPA